MHLGTKFAVVIGLLGSTALIQARGREMSFPAKIKKIRPAVVEIYIDGKRTGTGFFVSRTGHILTALHVVGKPEVQQDHVTVTYFGKIEVRLHDGRKHSAQPVANPATDSPFHDLALLKVEVQNKDFLQVGSYDDVAEGDEVYFMGFPFAAPAPVTYRGTVSSKFPILVGFLKRLPISSDSIQIQAPVARGFSGAPLVTFNGDKVVAVVTNRLGGISPKLDEIRKRIQQGKSSGKVTIMGVDPNESILELVNVLDLYLSAGTGWAISVDHIRILLADEDILKSP